MRLIAALAVALLTGCAGSLAHVSVMKPEQLADQSSEALCGSYYVYSTKSVRQELIRRVALTNHEWTLVDQHRLALGMSYLAALCSWGFPKDVNRTLVRGATPSEQWVYETYYGRTVGSKYRFVYIEDGKVVAIQD